MDASVFSKIGAPCGEGYAPRGIRSADSGIRRGQACLRRGGLGYDRWHSVILLCPQADASASALHADMYDINAMWRSDGFIMRYVDGTPAQLVEAITPVICSRILNEQSLSIFQTL